MIDDDYDDDDVMTINPLRCQQRPDIQLAYTINLTPSFSTKKHCAALSCVHLNLPSMDRATQLYEQAIVCLQRADENSGRRSSGRKTVETGG